MGSEFIDDERTEVRNERMTRSKVDKEQSVSIGGDSERKRQTEKGTRLQTPADLKRVFDWSNALCTHVLLGLGSTAVGKSGAYKKAILAVSLYFHEGHHVVC